MRYQHKFRLPVADVVFLTVFLTLSLINFAAAERFHAYIGTYTGGESKGIYLSEFDSETGGLTTPKLVAEAENPSFLTIHASGKNLYAVSEIENFQGTDSGAIRAYRINAESGALSFLNEHSSGGAAPCHLIVDKSGKYVLTANYSGGNCNVVKLEDDGSLGSQTAFRQHKGSSLTDRQNGPHAHSIRVDAGNRFAFVADLGLDQVIIYKFDAETGTLQPNDPANVAVKAGSGPRHFNFHPDGKHAYVINEIANTINVFAYDASVGKLTNLQTITTLPEGFAGQSHTAEVVIHPTGKFVYGSNRGHDSIAVFKVDPDSGKLTSVEIESTLGKTPRNFVVDPTGKFLLAENQSTNTIVVFAIDQESGALASTGNQIEVPSPVCIQFLAK